MWVDRGQSDGNGYTVLIKFKQSFFLLLLANMIKSLLKMKLKYVTVMVRYCHNVHVYVTEPTDGECSVIWKHYIVRILLQYSHHCVP